MTKSELDIITNLINIQGDSGNWDYDPYMFGMYNGMVLIKSVLEDNDPEFRDAPENWIGKSREEKLHEKYPALKKAWDDYILIKELVDDGTI